MWESSKSLFLKQESMKSIVLWMASEGNIG